MAHCSQVRLDSGTYFWYSSVEEDTPKIQKLLPIMWQTRFSHPSVAVLICNHNDKKWEWMTRVMIRCQFQDRCHQWKAEGSHAFSCYEVTVQFSRQLFYPCKSPDLRLVMNEDYTCSLKYSKFHPTIIFSRALYFVILGILEGKI